jgi:hypothetical protein
MKNSKNITIIPTIAADKRFADQTFQSKINILSKKKFWIGFYIGCLRTCNLYTALEICEKKSFLDSGWYFLNQRYDNLCQNEQNTEIGKFTINKAENRILIVYKNPQISLCIDTIKTYYNFQYKFTVLKRVVNNITDLFNYKSSQKNSYYTEHTFYFNSSEVFW